MKKDNVLDIQEGGNHYKEMGSHQPWEVLKTWLTDEEFRGFMKGTAIAYLARERSKGGKLDIKKASHTLLGYIQLSENEDEQVEASVQDCSTDTNAKAPSTAATIERVSRALCEANFEGMDVHVGSAQAFVDKHWKDWEEKAKSAVYGS
jgi:hypothetical protein